MTAADFHRIALSLEGVEEYSHAGLPAFQVGGRKFASLASQAEGYGNLMLALEQQAAWSKPIGAVQRLPVPRLSECVMVSSLWPPRRAFGRRLLLDPSGCRATSGVGWARHRSCRASSTICTAGSGGNPLASPPKPPDGQAA